MARKKTVGFRKINTIAGTKPKPKNEKKDRLSKMAEKYNMSKEEFLEVMAMADENNMTVEQYLNSQEPDDYEDDVEIEEAEPQNTSGVNQQQPQQVVDKSQGPSNVYEETPWGQEREYMIDPREGGIVGRASNEGFKQACYGNGAENTKKHNQPVYGGDRDTSSGGKHVYSDVVGRVSDTDHDDLNSTLFFN